LAPEFASRSHVEGFTSGRIVAVLVDAVLTASCEGRSSTRTTGPSRSGAGHLMLDVHFAEPVHFVRWESVASPP
jgi:hypothetical protein